MEQPLQLSRRLTSTDVVDYDRFIDKQASEPELPEDQVQGRTSTSTSPSGSVIASQGSRGLRFRTKSMDVSRCEASEVSGWVCLWWAWEVSGLQWDPHDDGPRGV